LNISDYSCFPNLQELDLSFNALQKVEKLEKLHFLQKLDLTKNSLTHLPSLPRSIRWLGLGYNQLSSLTSFPPLTQLHTLELQHNILVDVRQLRQIPQLHILKLEYNKIQEIEDDFFEKFPQLQHLSLAENPLPQKTLDKWNSWILQKNSKS